MTRIFAYVVMQLLLLFWLQAPSALAQPVDLSLADAIGKTLERNYGIIVSRSETEIAGINNSWGRAGRYPSIGADLSTTQSFGISSDGVNASQRITPGVSLRWLLFDGYRVNITKDRLDQLEELSGGQSMVVIENTVEDVILAYYDVLLQIEKLAVYEEVLRLASDRYEYELSRRELGGSVTYNVLLAKNEFLTEKALTMSQEVAVRNSIRALNYLMTEDPEVVWNFTTPFEAVIEDYAIGDLLSRMKESNQVLKNQYISLSLKQSDEKLARSELFPSLSLSSGVSLPVSRASASSDIGPWSGSLTPTAGLTLSYDIFNGGVRRDAIRIARISQEIAETGLKQMEHALTNQIHSYSDLYQVRKALLSVAGENLEAASLNLEISDEKYRSGLINQFNYRDIQLIYQSVAIRRLEAVFGLIESQTALTRITGGFLKSD